MHVHLAETRLTILQERKKTGHFAKMCFKVGMRKTKQRQVFWGKVTNKPQTPTFIVTKVTAQLHS